MDPYLQQHRVPALFREMLAKLLQTRPEKPKEAIVAFLRERKPYFTKGDFEAMASVYFGERVSLPCLLQALAQIHVPCSKEMLLDEYPHARDGVQREEFVRILSALYSR